MSSYVTNYDEAREIETPGRTTVYGTVVYQPHGFQVDRGPQSWPRAKLASTSARMLLISTWTDCRWGFIGGGMKPDRDASPLDTLHREIQEELGQGIQFTDDEYCFSYYPVPNGNLCHLFCKVISDSNEFQNLLQAFEQQHKRETYVNEVMAITGMPLYYHHQAEKHEERGAIASTIEVANVHGLPRYLSSLSPTWNFSYIVQEHFMCLLLHIRIVTVPMLENIVLQANALPGPNSIDFAQFIRNTSIISCQYLDEMEKRKYCTA